MIFQNKSAYFPWATSSDYEETIFFHDKLILQFFVWIIIFLSVGTAWSKRIVVFTPTSENNTYWPQVYEVLHAVAEDLHIQLDIYEFNVENRFAKHIEGIKILSTEPKPDGAIFSVAFGNSKPLLEVSESLNIPVFIQGPIFPSELPKIGGNPRIKYKTWIGYFYQDEFKKGYLLGKTLLDKAHRLGLGNADGKILVAGIGGDYSWFGSKLRQDGLLKAVNEYEQVQFTQVVPTKWTETEAYTKTLILLNRYKDIPVVWAASDQLGIGVSKALYKSGYTVGKDAVTGGLDLSHNGLLHIADGQLSASVSASMLQYAEVLIYLFDYIHGIDFVNDVSTKISASLHVATQENVGHYLNLLSQLKKVDYSRHSKYLNPLLETYDFSAANLSFKETN